MFNNKTLNFIVMLSGCALILLIFLNTEFLPGLIKSSRKPLCKNCNVLILDIDIVRSDAIDCINKYALTPNICKLKQTSVSFENHANQSALTVTSFVTTMSSLYPSSHGVWNDIYSTDIKGIHYLSEILHENGYHSTLTGHVLNYWQVVPKGYDNVVDARHIYDPGFKLVDRINELKKKNSPFLLHVYLDDTHFPYLLFIDKVVPNKFTPPKGIPRTNKELVEMQADYIAKNYKKIFTEEAIKINKTLFSGNIGSKKLDILQLFSEYASQEAKLKYIKDAWGPTRDTFFQNFDQKNPENINYLKENYLGILHLLDESLGETLSYIENSDLNSKTIIVFKSAHGEEFLEHGSFQHGNNLYQELIHTPLIIKVPGVKPSEVKGLTEDVDVMPTILDLLGISIPPQAQGKSLVPMMLDPGASIRDYQIAQKGDNDYVAAFRQGNLKLIMKEGLPYELYNLASDPGEHTNILKDNAVKAAVLMEHYESIVKILPRYGQKDSPLPTWLDEQKKQRLKDEGYF